MKITLEYKPDEREVKALEELLPFWQRYKDQDGTFPFEGWGIEKLLKTLIETGIKNHTSKQIKRDQWRNGLISDDEMFGKGDFRTKEERESLGAEKGEEQC